MKILFIIANENFKDIEYYGIRDKLTAAGHEVVTASKAGGFCVGADGMEVPDTECFYDVFVKDFGMMIMAGGGGCLENVGDEKISELMSFFIEKRKFGAICLAPRIALYEGLLAGYNVTGWDGDGDLNEYIQRGDAERIDDDIVIDRNVITGNGPHAAVDMGDEIVKMLEK